MRFQKFLGPESPGPDSVDCLVLPLPYEGTVTYGQGTKYGPQAILAAAASQVEYYDTELRCSPCDRAGIVVVNAPKLTGTPVAVHRKIATHTQQVMAAAKHSGRYPFLIGLGGEHSVTFPFVQALLKDHVLPADIGVLHIDAHADLRDSYDGSPLSHASVMRRIQDDLGLKTVHVGIRAIGDDEPAYIKKNDISVFFAPFSESQIPKMLAALPKQIFITLDVDGLDPSIMPATGTPVPGGLLWYEALSLLRNVFAEKDVLGMDIVELAPIKGFHAPNFLVAQLAYKCIGYKFCL